MKKTRKDYGYVLIQLLLFAGFFADIRVVKIDFIQPVQTFGKALFVFGILIVVGAILQLNRSLSPFPTPKDGGKLVHNGLYHYFRHPIYSGISWGALGFSFATDSGSRLILSICLFVLFTFKSNYEEERLLQTYPEYRQLMNRTWKFFPKLF